MVSHGCPLASLLRLESDGFQLGIFDIQGSSSCFRADEDQSGREGIELSVAVVHCCAGDHWPALGVREAARDL